MTKKRSIQKRLQRYKKQQYMQIGMLGNYSYEVEVPNRPNYVYVRLAGQVVSQVYNDRVNPVLDLQVYVGYDDDEPNLLQVLGVRSDLRRYGTDDSNVAYLPAHHTTHEWMNYPDGGNDVVFVETRQIMPLRPNPLPTGVAVFVNRGIILGSNKDLIYVTGGVADFSAYIPTTGSTFALLGIDSTTGAPVITTGGFVKDTLTLSFSDAPDFTPGTYPIAIIRLYEGQNRVEEAYSSTDLADLRSPFLQSFLNLFDVPGSFTGSANKGLFVNSAENRLEFRSLTGTSSGATGSATTFLELTDTPSSYVGSAERVVAVNNAANGLEFRILTGTAGSYPTGVSSSFVGLNDTPNSYIGSASMVVAVNDAMTGLEFRTITGSGQTWNVQEDYSSQCNGATVQFSTSEAFLSTTTMVFLNGLLQRPGTGSDYVEDEGLNSITFTTAPLTGDHLNIAYVTSGTGPSTTTITDLYIATTGSDTTGNGTSGSPFATLAKALSVLPDHLYSSVTIHVADGVYGEPITLQRFLCQSPDLLKISGNTTTPSSVSFTGTVNNSFGDSCGCLVSGRINAELEGIQVNVAAVKGVYLCERATLAIDRCTITGTISSRGVEATMFSYLTLHGDISISGWAVDGLSIFVSSYCRYITSGTLTVNGPGSSGNGIHIYGHGLFQAAANPVNITVADVKYGFQLGLNALFQHITPTGTVTIDNDSKPASSAGIQCTDLSSWSTTQAVVIDNFTNAFEANSISYIEAQGSRTITNCTSTSSAVQNSVIYLP